MVYAIIAGLGGGLSIRAFLNICGKLKLCAFLSRNYAYTQPLCAMVKRHRN